MSTKVLVVDDSALMRKKIRAILEDAGFEVVTARDGQDGLDRCREEDPDVVTLDINMPVMDGLTCLAHLMTEMPRPVVMVSSLTEKGAVATFEALELGAVDFIPKPDGTVSLHINRIAEELVEKVRAAARAKGRIALRGRNRGAAGGSEALAPRPARPAARKPAVRPARRERPVERQAGGGIPKGLVVIGVSTGGPSTLERILPELPADFPFPVIVAQHMPATFTSVFARRLDGICQLVVQEVRRAVPIETGNIYIGKGDADVVVARRGARRVVTSVPAHPQYLWHPSVERLVRSVLEHWRPERVIAVQLTGMGYDGAAAMKDLHDRGGKTIAESEESAVVYGMPRELVELGGADVVIPADKVAGQLRTWARKMAAELAHAPA